MVALLFMVGLSYLSNYIVELQQVLVNWVCGAFLVVIVTTKPLDLLCVHLGCDGWAMVVVVDEVGGA